MDQPQSVDLLPALLRPTRRPSSSVGSNWDPPAFPVNLYDLPPLPAIRDSDIALQARTSKDYLVHTKGTVDSYSHEIASYRPLEWLGDGKLHQIYSLRLYKRLPGIGPGVLSTLRESLETNSTQSYFGWAYELDLALLEPPPPTTARSGWQPLSRSQNIVADLFEAHIGGLVNEGREQEVDRWVDDLLEKVISELRLKAEGLVNEARSKKLAITDKIRKRGRDRTAFEEGWETDPVTHRRRTSLLTRCPMEASSSAEPSRWRWDDRNDLGQTWHSHLVSGNTTIACGRAKKQVQARDIAIFGLLDSLQFNLELRNHLVESTKRSTEN